MGAKIEAESKRNMCCTNICLGPLSMYTVNQTYMVARGMNLFDGIWAGACVH
jgi:hypothetical protein